MCSGFSLKKKKTSTVSLSVDVRITMISGIVYLLRIFKMFHGLMNNPVYTPPPCYCNMDPPKLFMLCSISTEALFLFPSKPLPKLRLQQWHYLMI